MKCPCGGTLVTDLVTTEESCSKCGIVSNKELIEEIHDTGPDAGSIHTGLLHDRFLTTTIAPRNNDFTGKALSHTSEVKRLRDTNKFLVTGKERNYKNALENFQRLSQQLMLKQVIVDRAFFIYQKAKKKELTRGRTIYGIVAACLYIACQEIGTPFPFEKIKNGSPNSRKTIMQYRRLVMLELDMPSNSMTPEQYISKISSGGQINVQVQRKAVEIIRLMKEETILRGKNPINVAAAILYIAANVVGSNITQKTIAQAADLTEAGIRGVYKLLMPLYKTKYMSTKQ